MPVFDKGEADRDMKKPVCIIVIGAECSGTRLATRMCIAAGCKGDATPEGKPENDGWPQHYDVHAPGGETPIVIRRSQPYHPGRVWVDLDALSDRVESWGYEVKVICTCRMSDMIIASQLRKLYIGNPQQGADELTRCYAGISEWVESREHKYCDLLYEDILHSPLPTINRALKAVGLPKLLNLPERIFDGNAKHRTAE